MNPGHVDELYTEYLEGTLNAAMQERVEEHLHSCARCTAELAELRQLRTDLRALPVLPLPADFKVAVRERIRLQQPAPRQFVLNWRVATFTSTLAAAAVFMLLLLRENQTMPNMTTAKFAKPPTTITATASAPQQATTTVTASVPIAQPVATTATKVAAPALSPAPKIQIAAVPAKDKVEESTPTPALLITSDKGSSSNPASKNDLPGASINTMRAMPSPAMPAADVYNNAEAGYSENTNKGFSNTNGYSSNQANTYDMAGGMAGPSGPSGPSGAPQTMRIAPAMAAVTPDKVESTGASNTMSAFAMKSDVPQIIHLGISEMTANAVEHLTARAITPTDGSNVLLELDGDWVDSVAATVVNDTATQVNVMLQDSDPQTVSLNIADSLRPTIVTVQFQRDRTYTFNLFAPDYMQRASFSKSAPDVTNEPGFFQNGKPLSDNLAQLAQDSGLYILCPAAFPKIKVTGVAKADPLTQLRAISEGNNYYMDIDNQLCNITPAD